ncbi:MAG: hypothetical protein IJ542_02860 [Clostridia bacterium]|nr:hypothetical protein [Clostridia bacterium]
MEKLIEQPEANNGGAQPEQADGSIGKFKDATSLYEAYNNLQAEFTRKSQELAAIKKQNEMADELSQKEDSALSERDSKDSSENNSRHENFAKTADFDAILSQKLLKFAEKTPEALTNLEEIKQEIMSNKELLNLSDGVQIAFRLSREKQKYEPAEIVNLPTFVEDYILSNSEITNRVIDKYIKSLSSNAAAPKIMSGASSFESAPNTNGPKTLNDANKIFQKMLEK